ncbi:hypothetical protein CEXT_634911 [Caerostris extrusa]|uniref:Uncharacterized protein n=1 Tax=Caerostris extrusa TaxID=172846 RepID=A0AAV4WFQ8_CAEEX|nr:hypothetical protein CEXT_634911 [Caerostris extrusa]
MKDRRRRHASGELHRSTGQDMLNGDKINDEKDIPRSPADPVYHTKRLFTILTAKIPKTKKMFTTYRNGISSVLTSKGG